MSLRHVTKLLVVPLVLVACNDDVGVIDEEPIMEPQASIGEPFVYRGGLGTGAEWQLTVVIEGIECDVDIGEELDVAPGDDRFCVVQLSAENIGEEPNVEEFSRASTLVTDTGVLGVAAPTTSQIYREENDLDPLIGILPGDTVESALVFSISDDAEPTHLQLQAGTDDELVLVDLDD